MNLVKQMGWNAEIIPQSRRVRNKVASYRLRAEQAPTQPALRVGMGSEIVTMHVTKLSKPERVTADSTNSEPATWAQVARRTLGTESTHMHAAGTGSETIHTQAATGFGKSTTPSMNWQEEMDVTGSDDDDEDDDVSAAYEAWQAEQDMMEELPLADLPYSVSEEPKTRKPKKRKATIQRSSQFAPRASSSKLRVQKVESDVQALKDAVHALLQQVSQKQSLPSAAQVPHKHGVYKTSVPLSERLRPEMIGTASVAGDGACLWHSLQAHVGGFEIGTSLDPQSGHNLKDSLLALFAEHATTCAGVLGIPPENLQGVLEEWRPRTAWADARLIALVSAHYKVTVAVMNLHDKCLDVVSPTPQHLQMSQWWCLRFNQDHYEPAKTSDLMGMMQAVQASTFSPWYPKQECAGGASVAGRGDETCGDPLSFSPVLQETSKLDEVEAYTWNMGGWRAHAHILERWMTEGCRRIGFLQETHLSEDGQRSMQRELLKHNYTGCWGPCATRHRISNGRLRVDWGKCPGVAIIAHKELQICPRPVKTDAARKWFDSGRLLLAQVLAAATPILLICCYAPAGKEASDQRTVMFNDVLGEIKAQQSFSYLLGADFNAAPESNALSAGLLTWGASIPRFVSVWGQEATATYRSGEAATLIDGFIGGPDIHLCINQVVHEQEGSPHAVVTCSLKADLQACYPRVAPQVVIRRSEKKSESDSLGQEWDETHCTIIDMIHEQQTQEKQWPEATKQGSETTGSE